MGWEVEKMDDGMCWVMMENKVMVVEDSKC